MNSLLYSDSPGGKKSLGHNFIDGNNGCLMISCGSHFPNFHMHEVETRIHTEITRVNLVGGGTTFYVSMLNFVLYIVPFVVPSAASALGS